MKNYILPVVIIGMLLLGGYAMFKTIQQDQAVRKAETADQLAVACEPFAYNKIKDVPARCGLLFLAIVRDSR